MDTNPFIKQTLDHFESRLDQTLRGLTNEELAWRPNAEANSIAFVIWHTTRVEDRFMQKMVRETEEVWTGGGWYSRLGLDEGDTGVDFSVDRLASFPALSVENLRDYLDAVRAETNAYLDAAAPAGFDLVPDRNPFPEVPGADEYFEGCTIARMFLILIGEHFQHLGHAAYIRGLQRGMDG